MKSSWRTVQLGEVVDFLDSRRIPLSGNQRAQRRGPYPYYGASGVIDWIDDFIFEGRHLLVAEDGENLNSRKLPIAFFASGRFWVNNHAHIVRGKPGVIDDVFLQAWFAQADIGRYVTGAAQPKLSQASMRRIEIALPPLLAQRKIAAILSTYDDLIENNNRRIKLLEEMAQRIYREWFVEFRYPGHEGVPLVDSALGSIPERWEIRSFASLGEYVNGFAFKPDDWGPVGLPIVKIRELKTGITQDTPRYAGSLPPKYEIHDGDLLFSWSADLDAYLWTGGAAWLNQHLFRVDPQGDVPVAFLFHALKEHMGGFRSRAQGTTMRHIKRAALDQVTTVLPPYPLVSRFTDVVEPLDQLQLRIAQATRNLRVTRDLLLPRLIAGEIDVDDLNIELPEAA